MKKAAQQVRILKDIPVQLGVRPEVGACYEVMGLERHGCILFAVIAVGAACAPVRVQIGDEAEWAR